MTISTVSVVTLAIAAAAATTDLATRRVPNALTLGSALLALAYHATEGGGVSVAIGGWLLGAAIFLPVFLLGGMGAGDIKLLAALGAWMGPAAALHIAVGAALAGGALAAVVSLRLGYLSTAVVNLARAGRHWRRHGASPVPGLTLAEGRGPRLAYAVPILVGTLGALWLH